MIHNIYCLKPSKDKLLNGLAAWLNMKGIDANSVTLSGLVAGLMGAVCLILKQNAVALVLLGFSIAADLLDGTIARLEKQEKFSGKLLDSVCDRTVESVWIGALVIAGMMNGWAIMLAIGSIALFLCRLWAYQLGLSSSKIWITRFERMVVIILSVVYPRQVVSSIIYASVAVGTFVSCCQIIQMIFLTESHLKRIVTRHSV